MQRISDERAALEERVAVLERTIAAMRLTRPADTEAGPVGVMAGAPVVPPPVPWIKWPHMVDNLFLGLVVLIAAHWFVTTLPAHGQALFRLVALIVALPFGYRFERNSGSSTAGQVIAALSYGCFGAVALGLLDMAVAGLASRPFSASDVLATVAAIALSHFAGSSLARAQRVRADQAECLAASHNSGLLPHLGADRIKTTAETVKALYEAAAPIAAGGAAIWAACHHLLF